MANTLASAEHRALDVYVGIDVFGRNTYGGGKFNCYKVFVSANGITVFYSF